MKKQTRNMTDTHENALEYLVQRVEHLAGTLAISNSKHKAEKEELLDKLCKRIEEDQKNRDRVQYLERRMSYMQTLIPPEMLAQMEKNLKMQEEML